jgi:DNA-binding NarL/FixJ family response regulator
MKILQVMVVSHPGIWQRVLQRSFDNFPFVKVVNVVNGSLSASQLAKDLPPDIILIDSSIPFDDTVALLRNIKNEHLKTRSIVITDTTRQTREVIRAGADYTLPSYNLESKIGEILNYLKEKLPDENESSITTNQA